MKILHEGGGVWGVSRVILRLFYTLYHAVTKKKSQVFFSPSQSTYPEKLSEGRRNVKIEVSPQGRQPFEGIWGRTGVILYALSH